MSHDGTTESREGADGEGRLQNAAHAIRARRRMILAGVAFVILLGMAFIATRPAPPALAAVATFPDQGQEHVDPSGPVPEYNSVPPTSGPHAPQPAPCGIYRQDIPDVFAVHSLEHGAVVVRYNPTIPAGQRDDLEAYARDAGTHIIVAPRSGLDDPIVLTAWTKLLRLSSVDRESIDTFYGQYAQNGPERGVPCPNEVDEAASNTR